MSSPWPLLHSRAYARAALVQMQNRCFRDSIASHFWQRDVVPETVLGGIL